MHKGALYWRGMLCKNVPKLHMNMYALGEMCAKTLVDFHKAHKEICKWKQKGRELDIVLGKWETERN